MDEIERLLAESEQDAGIASDEAMRMTAEFGRDPLLMEFVAAANELKREIRSLTVELQQLKNQAPSSARNISVQVLLTRSSDLRNRAGKFKARVMEISRND